MSLRRMLPFLLINVAVSATVVLLVLFWWDSRREEAAIETVPARATFDTPVAQVPTAGAASASTGVPEEATEESEGPPVHIVQTGDTLGQISQLYDVPVADIAEANNIVNVNALTVGQELIIPVGGLPSATPLPTTEPTVSVSRTPIATEPPPEGTAVVEISEVLGVGDLTSEAVRITNSGSRPISLLDWQLLDEDGNVFIFVDVTLFGSSEAGSPAMLVHTEAGQNGPSDLYWGLETAVWESGETVALRDAEGTEQATYLIP